MSFIEFRDVSKTYHRQGVCALKDLNFVIRQKEFVSIIGPFGCGKTSILHLLSGLTKADSGEIKINGRSPSCLKKERKIGYVFQTPTLLPWRSVLENVMLPQEIDGNPDRKRACKLLEMVGLGDCFQKKPADLSGGMQQLVSIARSLALNPKILLLDEPFSSIDRINKEIFHRKLLKIHTETAKTTILVTHSLDEAIYLSDRVLVLTPRPAQVKRAFKIELSSRKNSIRFSKKFLDQVKEIRRCLIYEPNF